MQKSGSRGNLLMMVLLMMPICLLVVFSLVRNVLTGSAQGILMQKSTRAFYLSESGLQLGQYLLAANNFSCFTHTGANGATPVLSTAPEFVPCLVPGVTRVNSGRFDGYYRWNWNPGDSHASHTNTGEAENYYVRLYAPAPDQYVIESIGEFAGRRVGQEVVGVLVNPMDNLIFDNGSNADLTRLGPTAVSGKIHVNGDLSLRPWNTDPFVVAGVTIFPLVNSSSLHIASTSVTAAGQILRSADMFGIPDRMNSVVTVTNNLGVPTVVRGVAQAPGDEDDSRNPRWKHLPGQVPAGAIERFGGVLRDGQLGVRPTSTLNYEALAPGGFYDRKSTMQIRPATSDTAWLQSMTIYNHAEERHVLARVIDVATMPPTGSDTIIYSEQPLILRNATTLPSNLTVASHCPVYICGDFNSGNLDNPGLGTTNYTPMAAQVITADRIYKCTSNYYNYLSTSGGLSPAAKELDMTVLPTVGNPDPRYRYAQDNPSPTVGPLSVVPPVGPAVDLRSRDRVVIRAALVDGVPVSDTMAYRTATPPAPFQDLAPPLAPTNYYVRFSQQLTPHGVQKRFVFPNNEEFLEQWGDQNPYSPTGVIFEHVGMVGHLQCAKMADANNTGTDSTQPGYDPSLTPWVMRSSYRMADMRFGFHDGTLTTTRQPPLSFKAGRRLRWRSFIE